MEPERRARLANTVKISDVYTNLALDGNFIKWKAVEVDNKMASLGKDILTYKNRETGWEQDLAGKVIAYQALKGAFEDCFKVWERKGSDAREALKKEEA